MQSYHIIADNAHTRSDQLEPAHKSLGVSCGGAEQDLAHHSQPDRTGLTAGPDRTRGPRPGGQNGALTPQL
jgi:hypothetical protein